MNRQMQLMDPNAQQMQGPLGAAPVQMNPMVQALLSQSGHPAAQASGGGIGGAVNPAMLAYALRQPNDGKPDPIFGYGIGNKMADFGIGSTYRDSAATGALGSNAPGGFGFGSSY
jgi:hypothetical protein